MPSGLSVHSRSFPLRCSFPLLGLVEPKSSVCREMRSRTQPATPEPRTPRGLGVTGGPRRAPRRRSWMRRGLRCRPYNTEALAWPTDGCLLTADDSCGLAGRGVLIGNGEQSGFSRTSGLILTREQSPKSCGPNDPNVPLAAGSPATLGLYFPYSRW